MENRCFGNSKRAFARSFKRARDIRLKRQRTSPQIMPSHMPPRFVCKDSRRLRKIRIHQYSVFSLHFPSPSRTNLEVSIIRRSQQSASGDIFQPHLDLILGPLGHFLYSRCLPLPRLTITKLWRSLELPQMRTLRDHTADLRWSTIPTRTLETLQLLRASSE